MEWPISWDDVKKELEKLNTPVINLADYGIDDSFNNNITKALTNDSGMCREDYNVTGFWEKVNEIVNAHNSVFSMGDGTGSIINVTPDLVPEVNNLSIAPMIIYIPNVGYVEVKGCINRAEPSGATPNSIARLSIWTIVLDTV